MNWKRLRWAAIPFAAILAVTHAFLAHAFDEWVVGPVTVAIIFFVTAAPDTRRARELRIWERRMAKRLGLETKALKKVAILPGELALVAADVGLGKPSSHYELVPRIAYVSAVCANARDTSDHVSVLAKLEKPAPLFTVRPLPIVDGARVPNTGIPFKHAEFMATFLVEGLDRDAIKKWMTRPVRDVLCTMPDAWLRVNRRAMALTLYGPIHVDQIEDLVATGDVLVAEYGADGGPSLFGEDEDKPKKKKKKATA